VHSFKVFSAALSLCEVLFQLASAVFQLASAVPYACVDTRVLYVHIQEV
jgi:hypothetical protein